MNYERTIGIAHQRVVREKMALVEQVPDVNRDISNAIVAPVDRALCKSIILDYEWMGCLPAVIWFMYGIFYDGVCAGVVCYGPEYSENLGKQARESGRKCADWSKYGYEGKMILLSRGACVHWAHPHSGSKLIRRSMDLLPDKYEIVTATTDEAAGEIGTIYQACGFHYVGSMRDANSNVTSRRLDRTGWRINGKLYGTRSIRARIGNAKAEEILKRWPDAVKVKQHSKHRYFAFRGSRKAQRAHQSAIAHLIKPYPKRNASEASREMRPVIQPGGRGDDSTTTLQFSSPVLSPIEDIDWA